MGRPRGSSWPTPGRGAGRHTVSLTRSYIEVMPVLPASLKPFREPLCASETCSRPTDPAHEKDIDFTSACPLPPSQEVGCSAAACSTHLLRHLRVPDEVPRPRPIAPERDLLTVRELAAARGAEGAKCRRRGWCSGSVVNLIW